ncbi:hypothetical protein UFOVP124_8 [uncultured Caudovirales phage]|uniref:Uncharacterized protein n=1 Tax=uncultured Caudovirales phage TaxID=2100421 RepID=A0A6J5LBP4_9CAUD|nr:hypothetical protein UFOVP124_8 [uncultured Caudovirales phage]
MTSEIIITAYNRWDRVDKGPFWLDLRTDSGSWLLSTHRTHEQALKRARRYAEKHDAIIIDYDQEQIS